jgi:hypothetical protein
MMALLPLQLSVSLKPQLRLLPTKNPLLPVRVQLML